MAKKLAFEDEMVEALTSSFKKKGSNASAGYLSHSSTNIKDYISTGNPLLDIIISIPSIFSFVK